MLFVTVCIIALASGIMVLQSKPNSTAARLFFALILAITLWAMGMAVANIASTRQSSEIWRSIAALGWGPIYAIFLHFLLVLTSTPSTKRAWWFYVLLYTPAMLTILAFALPLGINPRPYHLHQTEFGWVNKAEHTIWDILFYLYYGSYTLIGLLIIRRWQKRCKDPATKKQARMIFYTILGLLITATCTDVILSSLIESLPQMAPILLLFPITIIYNTLRKDKDQRENPLQFSISYVYIIISVAFYVVLAFTQIRLQPGSYMVGSFSLEATSIRGIFTQLQMLISVYLVLREAKPGFIVAVVLNAASLLSSTLFLIRSGSPISIPGIISYLSVLLLVLIISSFRKRSANYIDKIHSQRKELQKSEQQLYHLAYYDALTGLPSREHFLDKIERTLKEAATNHKTVGIVFIDFDSFKAINDTAGHATGDLVLQQVADRLKDTVGEQGILARFGGDEFLLGTHALKEEASLSEITRMVMECLKQPISIADDTYHVSASIGVAVFPHDGSSPDMLIKHADIAMYEAKNRGKNQVVFSNEALKQSTTRNHTLANSLYWALKQDELELYYQPKISLENEEIIGFEALLRWNNPTYGMIQPDHFIPLAEQTGMIKPIGLWVLRTACLQIKQFQAYTKRQLSISVNLSIIQLKDSSIAEKIATILRETGTPAHIVEVEITESVAFQDEPGILLRLQELKEVGLSIAIDDFGTGYSSFSRLKLFPFDTLKIDIEFVRAISSNAHKDRAIIKSIIQLAKNLELSTLAEGVENEQQLAFLKEQECDAIQGYLFYRPLPVAAIIEILANP